MNSSYNPPLWLELLSRAGAASFCLKVIPGGACRLADSLYKGHPRLEEAV